MIGRNKEAPRATALPFRRHGERADGGPLELPLVRPLNGEWSFHWSPNPAQRPRISTSLISTSVRGTPFRCLPTGSCTASATRSTPTSLLLGGSRTTAGASRPEPGRVVPARLSRFRMIGTIGRSICISPESARRSTSGLTATKWVTAKAAGLRRSSISANFWFRVKTSWRRRSTATPMGPISSARISGASAGFSEMSSSIRGMPPYPRLRGSHRSR